MGRKSGLEKLVGGLATGAIFYGLWYLNLVPVPVALVLGILFGALPALGGLKQAVGDFERRREARLADRAEEKKRLEPAAPPESAEKTVLTIARARGGVVTPALVAVESHLTVEAAEKVLADLTARGHAEMRVKDNGTIDYRFPDLV